MKQQTVSQITPARASRPTPRFDELVAAVAAARWQANRILEQLATARQQFDEQIRPLVEQKDSILAALAGAEEALRTATLDAYAESRSKRPHPATGIRLQTRLVYDREAVTAYAREHLTQVLILDAKAFERVAATLHVPGVEVIEEAQATIAQDLRGYLPAHLLEEDLTRPDEPAAVTASAA
jgi:hypothetical protein